MALTIIVLVGILFCSCSFQELSYGKAWVVTVGIDYANTYVATLNGTVRDSIEVGHCFSELYGYSGVPSEVVKMISSGPSPDEKNPLYPTAQNIINTLEGINASEQDLIVFFFSGHGLSRAGDSFIACAKDGEKAYTELWMTELFDVLSEKKCPCVAIIDSCFSGYLALNGDPDTDFSQAFENIFKKRSFSNVSVICSCNPEEKSSETSIVTEDGSIERHGIFTLKLLEVLGWEHSATGGSVISPRRNITDKKLYEKIIGAWFSGNQFPVSNNNVIGVNIIP